MKKSYIKLFFIIIIIFLVGFTLGNFKLEKNYIKTEAKKYNVNNSNYISMNIDQNIERVQDYYKKDDKVLIKITLSNTNNIALSDIKLNLVKNGVEFLGGNDYILASKKEVRINNLNAGGSIVIYAIYKVNSNDIKNVISEIEVLIDDYIINVNNTNTNKANFSFKVGCVILQVVNKEEKTKAQNAVFGLYKDSDCHELVSAGLVFENLDLNTTYYLKEITPPDNCTLYKETLAVIVDDVGKIQLKKYVANDNVQFRSINSTNEVPTIKSDGTAILTLSRTAINLLPNLEGHGNFYYVFIGTILMIGSIGFYIIYFIRKKVV